MHESRVKNLSQLRIVEFGLRIEKEMNATDMQKRTKAFALRVIKFVEGLSRNRTTAVIGETVVTMWDIGRSKLPSGVSSKINGRFYC